MPAPSARKQVVIVQGGPGTGKSVIAINLLVALIARKRNARYVSKNAAPRAVYEAQADGHVHEDAHQQPVQRLRARS